VFGVDVVVFQCVGFFLSEDDYLVVVVWLSVV